MSVQARILMSLASPSAVGRPVSPEPTVRQETGQSDSTRRLKPEDILEATPENPDTSQHGEENLGRSRGRGKGRGRGRGKGGSNGRAKRNLTWPFTRFPSFLTVHFLSQIYAFNI